MIGPEGCYVLLDDAGDVGWADAVPSGIAALVGGHHPAIAAGLVIADADNAVPFVVAQGAHVLLADLHLEVSGAHVVAEVRQHRRQVLLCFPVCLVVLQHHREGLAVAAGRLEVDDLVPGRVVRLPVYPTPLHPDDVDAPVLGHGVDEDQRLLALLAGVLEEGVRVCRELAAVGLQDFPEHVPAGAATTDADLRRPGDLVGVHRQSPLQAPPSPGRRYR
ncbi:hypothetical protein D3C76_1005150 [compost metagenome]